MIPRSRRNWRLLISLCCIIVGWAVLYLIHDSALGQIPPLPQGGIAVTIAPPAQVVQWGQATITVSYTVINPLSTYIDVSSVNWGDGSSTTGLADYVKFLFS